MLDVEHRDRALRVVGGGVVVLVGVLSAWATRHAANVDGISYLDLGDAFARGDVARAINQHWSPLYPVLLGMALKVAAPTPYWQFAVAHAVNVCVYIAAFVAFDVLLSEVRRRDIQRPGEPVMPVWAWYGVGYLIFMWASLQFIGIGGLTPDLAVSGIIYFASALVVRMASGEPRMRQFALLGVVLGVGYLFKAPLFPLGLVVIATAAMTRGVGAWRLGLRSGLVSLALFLVVAGPFVAGLSMARGHLTFGESRTLAYAWFVNKVPLRHWRQAPPGAGVAKHPTRIVMEHPTVYEFAEPIGGTYPIWYDPFYWNEGVRPRYDAAEIVAAIRVNARDLADMAVSYVQGTLMLGVLGLVVASRALGSFVRGLRSQWSLLVPVVIGLAMYSAVSVLSRYVAPFLAVLWVGILAAPRSSGTASFRRVSAIASVLVMTMLGGVMARELGPATLAGGRALVTGERPGDHPMWEVADALDRAGVSPGARVALVHPDPAHATWAGMVGWARLAQVRIAAEIEPSQSATFWALDASRRDEVFTAFSLAGATAAVTLAPPDRAPAGWGRLGATNYFVHRLSSSTSRDVVQSR